MLKSGGEAGPPGTVKSKRPLTDFQPFNLTAVKPRLIAEPDHHIEKDLIANPVPGFLNKTNLAKIADERKRQMEENKAKVAMKYSAADEFTFETAQRRDHASVLEELRAKAEEKFMEECTFQPQAAKRIVPRDDAMVRQTVASVLKEDARLRQAMAKDAELLKQYEAELHDASHFYEWQEKMKKIHGKALASFARAVLCTQLDVRDKEQEAELEEKQKLVEHTCEEREKARIAEQEVLSLKQETAEQRWKEKELEMSKKKKEEELEMDRKRDLIRQIRALERVPRESAKVFDRAEATSEHSAHDLFSL
eukprot:g2952.t1